MGRRGPLRKPEQTAQGHRSYGQLAVVDGEGSKPKVPQAPKGLTPATRRAWRTYWTSAVASVACEVDLPAVRRLFRKYDEYDRVTGIVEKTGLAVKGSKGQIRLNPLADHASKLESEIARLETELGLTPMARARLGLTVARGALTVEEINRMARRGPGDDDDTIEAELLEEWAPTE